MTTRRDFFHWAGTALGCSCLAGAGAEAADSSSAPGPAATDSPPKTDSDVGSLFPFIQRQARRSDFPLSFLRDEFKDLHAWKQRARNKLLELLHYAPPRCEPRPEVVEKTDQGDHVREKVYFNTTPDIRVPAYVLIPKKGKRPLPALVALHDHGVVGAQRVAKDMLGTERGGAAFEIPKQCGGDAVALPAVADRQPEFERGALLVKGVARFGDDSLEAVNRHRGNDCEALALADLEEIVQQALR